MCGEGGVSLGLGVETEVLEESGALLHVLESVDDLALVAAETSIHQGHAVL